MNDREKLLVGAVVALVALWGATQGWGKYQRALENNLNQQRSVAQSLSDARTATARGRRAQKKLRQWQRQSLPSDVEIAKSVYQDWLQQQLSAAGLTIKELNVQTSRTKSDSYQQLSLRVRAEGKLAALTDFLYRFYQAKHLHRISKMDLKPNEKRTSLSIALTVDALSLTDAKRKDQLAEGTQDTMPRSLEQFQKSIVGRNLFAVYAPDSPPETVGEQEAEDSEAAQAFVRGIHYGLEGWQMSVRMKTSGKVFYFREGDAIKIGRFEGTIEKLDGERRRVIVSTGSQQVQVQLGQNLSEAVPLEGGAG